MTNTTRPVSETPFERHMRELTADIRELHERAFRMMSAGQDEIIGEALSSLIGDLGRGMHHAAVARRRRKLVQADPDLADCLLTEAKGRPSDLLGAYATVLQEFSDDDAPKEPHEPADNVVAGPGGPGDAEELAPGAPDEDALAARLEAEGAEDDAAKS